MVVIKFYAHLIAPIGAEGVGKAQFNALQKVQDVAASVSRMFKGKQYGTDCGIIQVDDTVSFTKIKEEEVQFILDCHPYAREINKPFRLN